ALLESGCKVDARTADSRKETEENPGEDRDAESKQQDMHVKTHRRTVRPDARDVPRADGKQQTDSNETDDQPKKAAGQRYRQAFGKQLPDDVTSAGTQSGARRKFTLTGRRTDEQKVGNVGTGDEQHERDCTEQDQKRQARIRN